MLVDQKTPRSRERLVECSQKLVGDLAQRLRLVRELADVVAVVDGAPAERLTWVHDHALVPRCDERDVVDAAVHRDVTACPRRPRRVLRTLDTDDAAARHSDLKQTACGPEHRRRKREHRGQLVGEPLGDACIEASLECRADRPEIRSARNRYELLPADRLAARLDAALVVSRPWTREARLEQVVICDREEARCQLALATDEDLANSSPEIVVDDPMRHCSEASERADVPVEEARLILAWIEPREVAARVHEAHHEHVRLAPNAGEIDENFEEVDLRRVSRLVDERNEDLLAPPLPLANDVLDDGVSDVEVLADEHGVQTRRGEPLLACSPALRVLEDLECARSNCVGHGRARHAAWLACTRWRTTQVTTDRIAIDAHLARDTANGDALDQVSVTYDVDLFHSEHPPSERRASDGGSGGGGWVNFGAPKG